jgi:uncharacterized protein YhaN
MSVQPAQVQRKIENVFDTRRKLEEAIKRWENERVLAEAELIQSFDTNLTTAPLLVDGAIAKYEAWNAKGEPLAAKITAAETVLAIIKTLMEKLEKTEPAIFRAFKKRYEEQQESEEAFLKTIEGITKKAEKPAHATTDKSKKEENEPGGGQEQRDAPQDD